MNFTVDGIFKILNFLARIGVVIFVIRRYFVSQIQTSIKLEKNDLELLQQKHAQLRESVAHVEQQMKKDEQIFAALRSKFEIWNQEIEKHAQNSTLFLFLLYISFRKQFVKFSRTHVKTSYVTAS